IRLNLKLPSDLSIIDLTALEIDVYYAFYNHVDLSIDCSGYPWATDEGYAEGVNLNLGSVLGDLGLTLGDLVKNPTNAIDQDTTTASMLIPNVLGVANTTSQTITFNGVGNANDEVSALISLNSSLL